MRGVRRRFRLRRHEIARIGDLRGERRLIGATKVPVGLIAPVLGGAAANCEVPWPLAALVRDACLEANKAQPDRRNNVGTRRIGGHNGAPARPRTKKCLADRFGGRWATGPGWRHDRDGSAAEFAIEAGELAQLRRGMAIEPAGLWLDKDFQRARSLGKYDRMPDPVIILRDRGYGHTLRRATTGEWKQQAKESNCWARQFSGGARGVDHD